MVRHSRKEKRNNIRQDQVQGASGSDVASRKPREKKISFFKLFRFVEKKDKIYMWIGTLAAMANGAALPIFALVFGGITTEFSEGSDSDDFLSTAGRYSIYFLIIGVGSFFLGYISFGCWMITGERQAIAFRKAYFKALIKQEIAFFDSLNPNEFASKIAQQCVDYQAGVGEKVSTFIYSTAMVISGFLIGYIKGWQLALVVSASIPVMGFAGTLFVWILQRATAIVNDAYAHSGAIAEEAFTAIRTVVALGGQEKEVARYTATLDKVKKKVLQLYYFGGGAFGLLHFSNLSSFALAFWYGSKLIEDRTHNAISDRPYNVGDVLAVFFSIMIGAQALAQLSPSLKCFADAKEAATAAYKIIDRKSLIDVEDKKGIIRETVEGDIEFKNVEFAYPTKKDKQILKGITFKIHKNQKTAFVGESGCGKTTCMQLIERFYDIDAGSITLDGTELKELNLKWLRSQIGYVGQEPVLFATTIRENMLFAKEDATGDEIWAALKKANAEEFVRALPQQLETYVGTSGTQLSGGQKQRLAIARAILKNPRILLLDEATSALDRKNEMEIQKTLDEIAEGRTTIVIAHRLTTIQNADRIIVFDQGQVVEEGNHESLIEKKGKYYDLQKLQLMKTDEDSNHQENKEHEIGLEKDHADSSKPTDSEEKVIEPKDENAERRLSSSEVITIEDHTKVLSPEEKKKQEELEKKKKKHEERIALRRLFAYDKSKRPYFIVACIFAVINGAIFPFFALIIADLLEVLALPEAPDYRERANRGALFFFILAIIAFFANLFQSGSFGQVAQELTMKLRRDLFAKLLKMDMAFFDRPENTPGALCSTLANDCAKVQSLTSTTVGVYVSAASSFITGITIAFIASWRLSLICLAASPIMVMSGRMQSKLQQGFSKDNDLAYQESGSFVAEAVNNMRTVASFGREENLCHSFNRKLDPPLARAIRKGNFAGLAFGFSNLAMFCLDALVFYLGAVFISHNVLNSKDFFTSFFAIMMAAMGTGQATQFAGDVGAAKNAAINLFKIFDTKPEIDIDDPAQDVRTPISGNIELRDVYFRYPTRPKMVLKGVNLTINTSNKVALVGPSGCGKSTILSLLLRFYDVTSGEILVDGVPIKRYDLRHLRKSFGVVSQEPTLFNGTIEYNIKYTNPSASDEQMKEAAREANALGFIEANQFDDVDPIKNEEAAAKYGTGFQRLVGPKGSQISGGQKQRIAIARAILNKPNILLLDEATSALDSQNEKIVQESLDKIMAGKTSIVVAHRISTIKDANKIVVFYNGKVVEEGTYETLTEKQGLFYKLERGLPL